MNKENNGENLIISPLSIFQTLSLAANGAKGKTLSEMLDLLKWFYWRVKWIKLSIYFNV